MSLISKTYDEWTWHMNLHSFWFTGFSFHMIHILHIYWHGKLQIRLSSGWRSEVYLASWDAWMGQHFCPIVLSSSLWAGGLLNTCTLSSKRGSAGGVSLKAIVNFWRNEPQTHTFVKQSSIAALSSQKCQGKYSQLRFNRGKQICRSLHTAVSLAYVYSYSYDEAGRDRHGNWVEW